MRRKFIFFGLLIFLLNAGCKPGKKADPALTASLQKKLANYMEACRRVDIDTMMAYYYPRIFSLLPADRYKEALIAQLKNTDQVYTVEKVMADTLYPVFELNNAWYSKAKVRISVLFPIDTAANNAAQVKKAANGRIVHEISTEMYPAPKATLMATLMKGRYPGKDISIDTVLNSLRIQTHVELIAVKDSVAPGWAFIGLQPGDTLLRHLLNVKAIEKLSAYQ